MGKYMEPIKCSVLVSAPLSLLFISTIKKQGALREIVKAANKVALWMPSVNSIKVGKAASEKT